MVPAQQRPSRIPTFDSLEEEAEFWDSHDLGEFEDELEPEEIEIAERPGHILSVRLESPEFRRLVAIARKRGGNFVTLAETWVLDALERAEAADAAEADRRALVR